MPTAREPDRMNAAELRVIREHLGLTGDALAAHLRVSGRTVRHWEEGKYPVPGGVATEIAKLETHTADFVRQLADSLADRPAPLIETYRTDADYREHDPQGALPASWHRAAVARVRDLLPDACVVYAEPTAPAVIPAFPIALFCQLLDVLQGILVDEVALEDPRGFLLGEIADLTDDVTGTTVYPDLLDAARAWTPRQAAGVLDAAVRYRSATRAGGEHGDGLRAAGYPEDPRG